METPPPDNDHLLEMDDDDRAILSEIRVYEDRELGMNRRASVNLPSGYPTPESSPEEIIIQKRGKRQKPLTWSPVDSQKLQKTPQKRQKTPIKSPAGKELRRSLRRRLILASPNKNPARDLSFELNYVRPSQLMLRRSM